MNEPGTINLPYDQSLSSIRVELGINAQKIMQHVLIRNEFIEAQIKSGLEAAFNEIIGSEDGFRDAIKESVKEEIGRVINAAANHWAIKNKIAEVVNNALDAKIQAYADQLAEKMLGDLG